jgi:hypothetical protein
MASTRVSVGCQLAHYECDRALLRDRALSISFSLEEKPLPSSFQRGLRKALRYSHWYQLLVELVVLIEVFRLYRQRSPLPNVAEAGLK